MDCGTADEACLVFWQNENKNEIFQIVGQVYLEQN